MRLDLTAELQDFEGEIQEWIATNTPKGLSGLVDWSTPWGSMGRYQLVEEAREHPLHKEWEERLLREHFICPHWPEQYGGRGWDPIRMVLFDLACHSAGVPRIERGMGESLVGPSLLIEGTEEQRVTFLPRIISGEDDYCQGFSEPDHGSDLAAVETRGIVDGDEIVITGQKVWTSGAHRANMIFVLCRTDFDAPLHRGLSFVLVPFTAENNVDVRQIKMLNGIGEFSEDFFDGARAPLFNVIGGLNNGWRVAMTALSYERGAETTTQYLSYLPDVQELIAAARAQGRVHDEGVRQKLAWAYANVELMRYAGLRTMSRLAHNREPGALEAINKLHWSEFHLTLGEWAIDLDDSLGLVRPDGDEYEMSRWQDLFLSSRSGTIYSGTSEIQRNIIAERVLGLPKEPKVKG
jgi:alkylation response protein AidB-like acyl-CoA dehydrogenase